jgi:hypothetical protein
VTRFERLLLHLSTWTTAASGLVYFWMKYLMRSEDPFSAIHHPWQPHMLGLHVLAAPFLVFALGLMTRDHIFGKIRDRGNGRGRRSGLWTVVVAGPMIASGYLIQVFPDPAPRRALMVTHLAAGCLFALLLLGHVVAARFRSRAAAPLRAGRRRGRRAAAGGRARLDWSRGGGVRSDIRRESTERNAAPEGRRP